MGFRFLRQKSTWVVAGLIITIALFSRCGTDASAGVPDTVDFNYHVKPILVQKCYLCHGPDESSRKANLRLDTYEGATALLKNGGRAIDPGHAANSMVVERIFHKDPDQVMPTPESNLKLTQQEMAILEKWIDQGAAYDPHWAFIQPDSSLLEKKYDENAVDYFIQKELEERGIKPAPRASAESLLRRVSYLLTGLPPTEKEQQLFLSATNEDAYVKMVDYYLQSPRFGERWARHWMDIARYAETRGHEFDYPIQEVWRYRDYLIRAFNADIPFDQLVREQLAGDLLPKPRLGSGNENESILGTAFLTMAEGTHSPVDVRKDEADRIDNMIDVTGKAFLGLTISCARCHDHKFDPISAKDYYSFYGVMEGTRFSPQPVNQASKQQSLENLKGIQEQVKLWAHQQLLESGTTNVLQQTNNQPATMPADSGYQVLGNFTGKELDGWKSDGHAFGKTTTLGDPVFNDQFQLIGIREGMASSRKTALGIYGALRSPDFTISTNFVGVEAAGRESVIRIVIDNFQLIRWPIYGNIEQRVNDTKWKQYVFDVAQWKGHKAYIELMPGVYENHVFVQRPDSYVDARYAITYNNKWVEPANKQPAVTALNRQFKKRKVEPAIQALLEQESQLRLALRDSLRFFYGVTDGFGRNSPVFVRGNHQELSADKVPRTFLTALGTRSNNLDVPGSGRLQLAEALLEQNNPLTTRVFVNRIWHHLFGRGIVETVDNFGLQGKLPSHPALLDYLSLSFKQHNYSVKQLIRTIVLSETFQRSTLPVAGSKEKDPANIYLSYFPLRRLEAEAIRDAMLAVSGRLDTAMYGEPVPQHITSFMNGRGKPSESGPLDGAGRRTIYLEVRRNFLDPILTSFDRPIPFTSFGKREVTNVPAQSLILMNDPFVMQEAARLAARLDKMGLRNNEEKIQWLYRTCLGRSATKEEILEANALLANLTQKNSRTVWKDFVHTIFNLKEFIYLN
ncbi:MAG: PSD1 domain-containing protein [Flavipsychrobacter sp.]|nr:PSD1 domain-containing protein [Flavipsychrobacter sp.]